MIFINVSDVFASLIDSDLSSYLPRKKLSKMVKQKTDFADKVSEIGTNANEALIPEKAKYIYAIEGKGPGTKINGIMADKNALNGIGKNTHHTPDTNDFFYFDLVASSAVKIKYQDLCIYDASIKGYRDIDIVLEVTGYSPAIKYDTFEPVFCAARNINGHGLPTINIFNIGTVQVSYTFYKAGTNTKISLNTSVTYGDIDASQAVSAAVSSTDGHMARGISTLYAGYPNSNKKWYAFSSPEEEVGDHDAKATLHKGGFYINSSVLKMRYTSNQTKANDEKPSGGGSHFATSTYTKIPPVDMDLDRPHKYVSDSDLNDDVDKNKAKRTHNTLSNKKQTINYYIVVELPKYMDSSRTRQDLKTLTFTDTIDDCLEFLKRKDGSPAATVYKRTNSVAATKAHDADPTDTNDYNSYRTQFNFKISGQTITATWKGSTLSSADRDKFYGKGDGAYVVFLFRAKIKSNKSLTQVAQAYDKILRRQHENGGNIDISNNAKMTYRFASKSPIK